MKPNLALKKIMMMICIIINIFILVLHLHAQDRLVISQTEGEWLGQKIAQAVLEYAYNQAGIKMDIESYPALRSAVNADMGITDGVLARMSGLEATFMNLIRVDMPVSYLDMMVYTKNISFSVDGWESLRPYTITFMYGNKLAEKYTVGMKIETTPTAESAFMKLAYGRTDLVIEARDYGCMLKTMNILGIKMLEPPLMHIETYHYLHKRHVALVLKLESILKQMEYNGEIERIEKAIIDEFSIDCMN